MADASHSIILNVLGMRICNQGAGCVSRVCASQAQAQARRVGNASVHALVSAPLGGHTPLNLQTP